MTEWEGLSRWTWIRGLVRALPTLPRAVWVQRWEITEVLVGPRPRQWVCGHGGTETTETTETNGRVTTVTVETVCLRCGKRLRPETFFTSAWRWLSR